jgi:hypothetical protein
MILGPLAEAQLRNAMSVTLLVVIAAVLILPRVFKRFSRKNTEAIG